MAEAAENGTGSSTLAVANTALRHARILIGVPLIAMVLAGLLGVLKGSTYVAESSFKPESRQAASTGLLGLASQFGLDLGSLSQGESLDYYARLLESKEILTGVLTSEYTIEGEGGRDVRADLLTLYEIEGPTEPRRIWQGVMLLRNTIDIHLDHAANVVTVRTEAPRRELAEQINARLLQLLNEFNLEKRQSQARSEREFVEAQARQAAEALAEAEARLADFTAQNRRYQGSPELINEAERLSRRVELRQQVYLTLAQALEQARLEEVRNTPVFTVLDRPEGAGREIGGLVPRLVLGLVLGLVLAGLWVFLREYVDAQRRLHPAEFDELRRRTRGIRRLWSWGTRRQAASPAPPPVAREREHPPAYHEG